jgi:hypothetical protein
MKAINKEKARAAIVAEKAKPLHVRVYGELMQLNQFANGIMRQGAQWETSTNLAREIHDHAKANGNHAIAEISNKALGCSVSDKQAWALAYYAKENQEQIKPLEILDRWLYEEEEQDDFEDLFEGDTLEEKIKWTQEVVDTVAKSFPSFGKAWQEAITGDEASIEKSIRIINGIGTTAILKGKPESQLVTKYFPGLAGKSWEDFK